MFSVWKYSWWKWLNSLRNGGQDYHALLSEHKAASTLSCGEDRGEHSCEYGSRGIREFCGTGWHFHGWRVPADGAQAWAPRAYRKPPSLQGLFPEPLGPGRHLQSSLSFLLSPQTLTCTFKQAGILLWEQGHNEAVCWRQKNHGWSQNYVLKWSSIITENSQIVSQNIEL